MITLHISNLYHLYLKGNLEAVLDVHPGWTKTHLVTLKTVFNKLPKLTEEQLKPLLDNEIVQDTLARQINLIRQDLGHTDASPTNNLNLSKRARDTLLNLEAERIMAISIMLDTSRDERAKLYFIPPLD